MKKRFVVLSICCIGLLAIQAQPPQEGSRPKPPSAEERLKRVTEKLEKELQLNVSQKQKIATAYKEFFASMEKLRKKDGKPMPPPPPPPPADKEAVDKLVKARDAQVKAVLTGAQFQKYTEIEKTMRPPGPGGKPPGDKKPQ